MHVSDIFSRHERREAMVTFFVEAGASDAQSYGAIVALIVPILGLLDPSLEIRLFAAAIFFAIGHVYWWIEAGWITAEIQRHGVLDTNDVSYQRRTMYWLYYGVIFAVVVWLLSMVGWFAGGWPHLHYGLVEWVILIHTIMVGRGAIGTINHLFDQYLQATAAQKRYETEERPPRQ
ncbi:MAG TPA: hypothetical protein VJG64_04120 [Candidatus Paceibacterota bacterium]